MPRIDRCWIPAGLARVGGNAFTILLVDVRSVADAATVAQRLLRAIAQPVQVNGRDLVLTASIGIALYPRDGDTVDALLRYAEQAMYAAKAAGRAGYRFFDEEMNAAASAKLEVENDLRHAIVAGQLRLYFQPKVNAASGTMTGAEALVRWQHPQRGLVPPGEFIPLAEESGLIVPIGDWVIQAACEYLQRWGAAGLTTVPLSINLSSPSFMQDTLVAQLGAAVRSAGLQTRQLTLEVTESLLMQDIEGTIARLHALREQGFGLSLDDFGTGYSSLSYLKRFPIDELKIDRSFVRDVMNGGRDGAIVASIIELGRQFGLTVVAEGVETSPQSGYLLDHGCTIQQGFLFARPMPAEQFSALLVRPQSFEVSALSGEPQAAAQMD